jgi:hypothetical protein
LSFQFQFVRFFTEPVYYFHNIENMWIFKLNCALLWLDELHYDTSHQQHYISSHHVYYQYYTSSKLFSFLSILYWVRKCHTHMSVCDLVMASKLLSSFNEVWDVISLQQLSSNHEFHENQLSDTLYMEA